MNMALAYRFELHGAKSELYFNVENLFDKDPPIDPSATSFQQPTNYQIYDVLGRRFVVGVRAKW